ncbi:MAG: hypothetical protein FWH05_03820 [Oscillospiraceae bacterium]|nr:hypothetical protein [Oscillospiraceae bacterium]
MRKVLAFVLVFGMALSFLVMPAFAQTPVGILGGEGWLESLCVYWSDVSGVSAYDVYVKKAAELDYPAVPANAGVHAPLVRKYPDFWRFDAVGLAKGVYDVKVLPRGGDDSLAAYATGIEVQAHDRSGFAFVGESATGGSPVPGAYNADGTLKDDAEVVYITRENYEGLSMLANNARFDTSRPLAIRFVGHFPQDFLRGKVNLNTNSMFVVRAHASVEREPQNITIEGIGRDTSLGAGFAMRNIYSVEVRNLGFVYHHEDGVEAQNYSRYIWIHNNDFFYGRNDPRESDKQKGDGSSDIGRSQYITLSYNRYWDSGKTGLVDGGRYANENERSDFITFHHNFYDHSDSRHPRIRHANVHAFNNYYRGIQGYGIGAAHNTKGVFAEGNYFENTNRPLTISMQGRDSGTFSSESGGIIKSYNNQFDNTRNHFPYDELNRPVEFDYVEVTSRDEIIPPTILTKHVNTSHAGSARMSYSNFDTDKDVINPDLYFCGNVGIYNKNGNVTQTPHEAKARVIEYAGRMQGGDLTYSFDCDVKFDGNCAPGCADQPKSGNPMPELLSVITEYDATGIGNVPDIPKKFPKILLGDCNNDGKINVADLTYLKLVIVGVFEPNSRCFLVAPQSSNKPLPDAYDITRLKDYLTRKIASLD